MSWREFQDWMLYNAIWPLGERRADLRAGVIAATIANVNRDKDVPAYGPWDLMPRFNVASEDDEGDDDASIELTQHLFESLTQQLGGIVTG